MGLPTTSSKAFGASRLLGLPGLLQTIVFRAPAAFWACRDLNPGPPACLVAHLNRCVVI